MPTHPANTHIHQSLQILLRTSLGERVMLPSYGCNLLDFAFDPMNTGNLEFLREMVTKAILFHEPRIRTDRVDISSIDSFDLIEGRLKIEVDYTIAGTNSRFNFVYDFYLRELNP